ncbi:unnamed protein product [Sphagnum jensenii]|uniref:NAC domain-containing protein n=1 Tax=Sphagnum jensenii TaxID=128206 RepID=A0ABP1AQX8_9BRYO
MTWLCQVGEEPGVLNSNSQQRGRMTNKDCPECGHIVRRSNAKMECMALPAGVRFDPSDEELLVHLAAKMGRSNMISHPLIDDFISFLDGEDGICGTHPEKLPGVKKDGSSCHFFHRPSMAYTTGTRKRRKIHANGREEVRWHKTGKTRPVLQNRKVLGFKKIMVLYERVGKKSKNVKTNWVMHQYHLGENEEETDGELVVCKVFFQKQPRNCSGGAPKTSDMLAEEECELSESDIDSSYGDMNLPGDAQQVGSSLELLEEFGAGAVQKMEDELELGSPPNMLEYPVVTSQEIRDWLGKNSSQVELDNTDSQSAC